MINNFDDEIELEEDLLSEEEDEETEGSLVSDKFYIQQGAIKLIKEFPLAFTVPDNLAPIIVEGFNLTWTKAGLQCLDEIQQGANVKNLPYGSLRNFLQVVLKDATRIEPEVGLSKYALNYAKGDRMLEPFVYLTGGDEEEINKVLRPIINDWFTNSLKPFAEKEDISIKIIDRLEEKKLL